MSSYGLRCPCCDGELVSLQGNEAIAGKDLDVTSPDVDVTSVAATEDTSSETKKADVAGVKTGIKLEFDGRGSALTKKFGWDGKPDTMPSEWIGNGYYIVAVYHEVTRGAKKRVVQDGCVIYALRYDHTSFKRGKEAFAPTIFKDIESAQIALKNIWDRLISGWHGKKLVNKNLIERKSWKTDEYTKEIEIIPVEDFHPVRRCDVLEELRLEALAEMSSEEQEKARKFREDAIKRADERARWREEQKNKPQKPSFMEYLREEQLKKDIARINRSADKPAKSTYVRVGTDRSSCSFDALDKGKPVGNEVVQDWSKVDWDAEDRESQLLEVSKESDFDTPWMRETKRKIKAELADIRRAKKGLATAKETEMWLLQDWDTYKFVKITDGDATLVDRDDCTFFEKLTDATNVALTIERLFWKPEYARWRLHVVPYNKGK